MESPYLPAEVTVDKIGYSIKLDCKGKNRSYRKGYLDRKKFVETAGRKLERPRGCLVAFGCQIPLDLSANEYTRFVVGIVSPPGRASCPAQ